jgi:hypothetical protein
VEFSETHQFIFGLVGLHFISPTLPELLGLKVLPGFGGLAN